VAARIEALFPLVQDPMPDKLNYTDDYLRQILGEVKTIAMVGASTNWNRPSYFAMKYLQRKDYRVIPVNPGSAGGELLGERIIDSLEAIEADVDMVDVFRRSSEAGAIVDQAIAIGAKVIWMQIGVRDDEAAERAKAAGLKVVMDRCPKIELSRFNGELSWLGFNSGLISSKRRRL
jgi:predicted CoA-binding protein